MAGAYEERAACAEFRSERRRDSGRLEFRRVRGGCGGGLELLVGGGGALLFAHHADQLAVGEQTLDRVAHVLTQRAARERERIEKRVNVCAHE